MDNGHSDITMDLVARDLHASLRGLQKPRQPTKTPCNTQSRFKCSSRELHNLQFLKPSHARQRQHQRDDDNLTRIGTVEVSHRLFALELEVYP